MEPTSLDTVYVVTKDGRRVEPNNYLSSEEAKDRASKLIQVIKTWDKSNLSNLVKVVKTNRPHIIR